jgi:hypothetical protein
MCSMFFVSREHLSDVEDCKQTFSPKFKEVLCLLPIMVCNNYQKR